MHRSFLLNIANNVLPERQSHFPVANYFELVLLLMHFHHEELEDYYSLSASEISIKSTVIEVYLYCSILIKVLALYILETQALTIFKISNFNEIIHDVYKKYDKIGYCLMRALTSIVPSE